MRFGSFAELDGSLVYPIPVSLCRALGADIIIWVSINGDLMSRPQRDLRAQVTAKDAIIAIGQCKLA